MPSTPLLEFDTLLAPIPGDNPAGDSIPFETREKLEEGRKEENPEDYAPDDPMRPESPKKADWPSIIRVAQETLVATSKDLLVSARLTEALVKQHGFAGLRDGLHLMRLLVEQCWDRLNPAIEDGDVEVRAGPFNWLDDPDRGARFPNTVRMVPLLKGEERSYGWLEWKQAQDGRGNISREDLDKAMLMTPRERCEALAGDIDQSLEELNQLTQILNAKMGPVAPSLIAVRQAIDDNRRLVQQILQKKGPAAGADGQAEAGEAPAAAAGTAGPARVAGSREQIYRQLAQAAAALQQLEPHSPIPYLIQRAVELGAMPFPQLIRALIREPNVLAELAREFGIKEETPPAAPAEPS